MPAIQVRIDAKTKKAAKKVLDKIGVDMSSAVKVYLKQIIITQGIPFRLVTANGLTPQEENAILKAVEEAEQGKNVEGPFETAEEVKRYLGSIK